MREKVIWLLEDKDAHFTANWLIADQILTLLREEVEKAENPNPERSLRRCGFEDCRQRILSLL